MQTLQATQLQRIREALHEAGLDFALLTSMANVTYASGYEVPVPLGALADLSYSGPMALIGARSGSWLLVPDSAGAAAKSQSWCEEIREFATFDSFTVVDSRSSLVGALHQILIDAGIPGSSAILGAEVRHLAYAVEEVLEGLGPKVSRGEAEGALARARSIKTDREIALLRRAAAVGDAGQQELAVQVATAGSDEFAMWGQITAAMHRAAGTEIPITGELVTGPRTNVVNYPGGPRARTTSAGDAALMDISGRVAGYWFDCCNTHLMELAEPTAAQRHYATASQRACEAAMAALMPGALASDAAMAAEKAFASFGLPVAHYTGHQIGVSVNELPRLVPYDHTPIEAGMVFCVEPGAYQGAGGNFGARSEKMVLVTSNGPEILSEFDWGLL